MASNLKALSNIISTSVDSIISISSQTGKEFPSLDDPVDVDTEFTSQGIRNDTGVAEAISLIVSAAFQLIQSVQSPAVTVATNTFLAALPGALSIAEAKHIPELIRLAGDKKVHVKELAAQSNMDPDKLAVVLRFLATCHYFKEVEPDCFSNNMLSSVLDSGKDPKTPNFEETKHQGSKGMSALVAFNTDEPLKAMTHYRDVVTDPATAFSTAPTSAGFQRAFNTDLTSFGYLATVPWRAQRFALAMADLDKVQPPDAGLQAFDWKNLPDKSLVVDVGGSFGHVIMPIAKKFPSLNFAIEDLEGTVEQAKEHWNTNLPSRVQDGTIHFIACDFFKPQPNLPQPPSVFLMRAVLHDWNNDQCISILKHLRDASKPDTKLVLIDAMTEYPIQSEGPNSPSKQLDESKTNLPAPLLENLGYASLWTSVLDLNVRAMLNAGERTVKQWTYVLTSGGWKVDSIRKMGGNRSWATSFVCSVQPSA